MEQQLLIIFLFVLRTQRFFFYLVGLPEEGILYSFNLQSYKKKKKRAMFMLVGINIYHDSKTVKANQTERTTVIFTIPP